MARKKEVATESTGSDSFSFLNSVKTGDKFADRGRKREINTWIDSGCYAFNAIISGDMLKGFPGNRVTMLAGEQAVGKTLLAGFGYGAALTRMGYYIFYIDTENAITDDQLIGYGFKEGQFKIITQSIIEELKTNFSLILDQLEQEMGQKMTNPHKCAFVLDSQGMLDTIKSRSDISKGNYVNDMTGQKELKRLYKSILVRLGVLDIPMLITNHVYANIGGYGDPTTVAGGSGGLYASSVILHLRKKQYKEGTIRKGTIIVAKNVKSRFTIDGQEGYMYLDWERGLNKWYGVHKFAEEAKLLDKYTKSEYDKKGVIGPEKPGNFNWYVIKDPKLTPDKWMVIKEKDIHKESTIGTIFNEVNDYIKDKYKLLNLNEFMYEENNEDGDEDLDINDELLVEVTDD